MLAQTLAVAAVGLAALSAVANASEEPASEVLPTPDPTDAVGVVEAKAVTGTGPAQGMTTYRLALKLGHDAADVYTIYGDKGRPMSFPPAFQVASPFGVDVSQRVNRVYNVVM